jgi:hypothetical protein
MLHAWIYRESHFIKSCTVLIRAPSSEILQELDQAGILPDLTDLEDSIHYALISRQYVTALEAAVEHDSWLAAHLADIMHELGLLKESDPARSV